MLGRSFAAQVAEFLSNLLPNPESLAGVDFLSAAAEDRAVPDHLRDIAAKVLAAMAYETVVVEELA